MARVARQGSLVELTDADARAIVAPARGAIVTRWSVAGEELLFLDEGTFLDPSKNVRGGIPVLFPAPGKLPGDRWSHAGRSGAMKQHGFARTLPWTIVAEHEDDGAALVTRLVSDAATRAQYPWDFVVTLSFRVRARSLRIDHRVEAAETNDRPMPFGFGFHPYFAVPDDEKRATTLETSATRAFDNVRKTTIDLVGLDLTAEELDLHLLDHGCSESAIAWNQGTTRVRVRASEGYDRWVIWTLAGKDFVCLEPWTSPGGALATGEGLVSLAPGGSWCGFLELESEPVS